MSRMYGILTDKAEVVTTHYVWNSDFDTSVGQLEAMGDNNWCLDFTGPQKDEGAVVVCDLGGLRRKVPGKRTPSGPSQPIIKRNRCLPCDVVPLSRVPSDTSTWVEYLGCPNVTSCEVDWSCANGNNRCEECGNDGGEFHDV